MTNKRNADGRGLGKGSPGHPRGDRSVVDIERVRVLARLGLSESEIAGRLGLTPEKLRYYFYGRYKVHGLVDALVQAQETELGELERRLDRLSRGYRPDIPKEDGGSAVTPQVQFNATKMLLEMKMPRRAKDEESKESYDEVIRLLNEGFAETTAHGRRKKKKQKPAGEKGGKGDAEGANNDGGAGEDGDRA